MMNVSYWICPAAAALAVLGACGDIVPGEPDAGQPNPGQSDAGTDCTRAWLPAALADPSFEEGSSAWIPGMSPLCKPQEHGLTSPFGTMAACFGTFHLAAHSLAQAVVLPPGTTQVRLHAHRCLVTEETEPNVYDWLRIELKDPGTHMPLGTLASWSNVDAGAVCDWVAFEVSAALSTEAAEVLLSFESMTDSSNVTSFYIDDLDLMAFGCTPSAAPVPGYSGESGGR